MALGRKINTIVPKFQSERQNNDHSGGVGCAERTRNKDLLRSFFGVFECLFFRCSSRVALPHIALKYTMATTQAARAIQEIVPIKQTVINQKLVGEVKKFLKENNHAHKLQSWNDEDIWVVLTEKAEPRNGALAAAFYIIDGAFWGSFVQT
jgi:hypothetical protein